ncbi:MAG: methylmalonyl Co-A mutase-associated GTPase MeaB [Bacteroidales bacterium]|nr:methylmalonyl Co-A mutase-associated GTPase MeaB [Bacteroidales bacterium]
MDSGDDYKSALNVQKGVTQPPSINPDVVNRLRKNRKKVYRIEEYVEGIVSGNRTILSQAITLLESSLPEHYEIAQAVIEKCLTYSVDSVRIGITGVPGAGKSTFIETFGKLVTSQGHKLAVLAIDPSSEQTRGSILGDKTRMETLSTDPNAFIRPSPAAGTLGGVARKTRETIILCEAAGFDTIFVETVGVGQSETVASSMVDFFLLLMLAGAGDELQGIKRGIMEMADGLAITKADGTNRMRAEMARIEYQNALHLYPTPPSGWTPKVLTCSSIENRGVDEVWKMVEEYLAFTKQSGYFYEWRRKQAVVRMHETIMDCLRSSFYNHEEIEPIIPELEKQLHDGVITSYTAACKLLNKYFRKG